MWYLLIMSKYYTMINYDVSVCVMQLLRQCRGFIKEEKGFLACRKSSLLFYSLELLWLEIRESCRFDPQFVLFSFCLMLTSKCRNGVCLPSALDLLLEQWSVFFDCDLTACLSWPRTNFSERYPQCQLSVQPAWQLG